jgi:hypothetical protein
VIAMTVSEFLFDTRAGLMLLGVFLLVVLLIVANYVSKPFEKIVNRRRLRRRGIDAYRETRVPTPPELVPGDASFEALGFEKIATIRNTDGSTYAIRLRPRDGVTAETVLFGNPKRKDRIVLELTSSLAGRQGNLATSTSGLGVFFWPGELRQVFPGATAEHLLEYHEEALASLAERGIRPDPLTAEEILPLRADMLNRAITAVARAPVGEVRAASVRAIRGQHAHVGKLMHQDDIRSRLDAFWRLAGLHDFPARPDDPDR